MKNKNSQLDAPAMLATLARWETRCVEEKSTVLLSVREVTAACREIREFVREAEKEARELQAVLDNVVAAIGTIRYMDPPDGGDVPLGEQIRRMREQCIEDGAQRQREHTEKDLAEIVDALETVCDGHIDERPSDPEAQKQCRAALEQARNLHVAAVPKCPECGLIFCEHLRQAAMPPAATVTEALVALVAVYDGYRATGDVDMDELTAAHDTARAAIAKAEGRS